MMRKALVGLAVLAIASTAMAVPSLVAIPQVTNLSDGTVQVGTLPTSITPDGAYVGGTAGLGFNSGVANDTGFVYNAATGVVGHVVAGGYQDTVNGIGYQYPTAGGKMLVIGGANSGWQSMNTFDISSSPWNGTVIGDASTYFTKVRRTNTHAYAGGYNTVAGSGGPVVYGTFYTPNSSTPQLYVDAITDGNAWASAPDTKGTTTNAWIGGVSSAGVGVGARKNSSGQWQNYVLTFNGSGGLAASWAAGLDGTNLGELWDIADNGSYAGGNSPKVGDARIFPYVRRMSDGAVFALPTIGGPAADATVGRVYGMSPDGNYAVGMDYSYGIEKAVLWDISDINNITALDLTQYAIDQGILGPFTGNLRKAFAMGIDAQGNPVVTGVGYASSLEASGWTGFVMTVPEPTTMLFLALGGLALLRRR